MKKRELEARLRIERAKLGGLTDALGAPPCRANTLEGERRGAYEHGWAVGQRIRESILTAAREQQTREQGLAADECLAGCGEPRDSTASRYCATCRKAIERVAPAQEPERASEWCWRHWPIQPDPGGQCPLCAQEPVEDAEWCGHHSIAEAPVGDETKACGCEVCELAVELADERIAHQSAIERAERAERERDKWIKVAESVERGYTAEQARAEAAEHERDELLAEIAKHKRDTLANYEVDGNTQDWRLWAVLSKEEGE